ncbi:hypothetical protein K2W90_03555 [Candidatus Babeliales bacterium]|nr:hypothetical protein [Candidatus Babeliales bacterium]
MRIRKSLLTLVGLLLITATGLDLNSAGPVRGRGTRKPATKAIIPATDWQTIKDYNKHASKADRTANVQNAIDAVKAAAKKSAIQKAVNDLKLRGKNAKNAHAGVGFHSANADHARVSTGFIATANKVRELRAAIDAHPKKQATHLNDLETKFDDYIKIFFFNKQLPSPYSRAAAVTTAFNAAKAPAVKGGSGGGGGGGGTAAAIAAAKTDAETAATTLLTSLKNHVGLEQVNGVAVASPNLTTGIQGFLTAFAAVAAATPGDLPANCTFTAAGEAAMKFATSAAAGKKFTTAKTAAGTLNTAITNAETAFNAAKTVAAYKAVEDGMTTAGQQPRDAYLAFIAAFDAAVEKADPRTGLKKWLGAKADAANLLTDTLASDANMKTGAKYDFDWPALILNWTAPSDIETARNDVVADITANAGAFKDAILANLQAKAKDKSGDISGVPNNNDLWLMDTPGTNGVAANNDLRTIAFNIADATHKATTKVFTAADTAVTYGTEVQNLKTKAELIDALKAAYRALIPAANFKFTTAGNLNDGTITAAFNNGNMTTWLNTATATDNAKNNAAHTACQTAAGEIAAATLELANLTDITTAGNANNKANMQTAITDAHAALTTAVNRVATAIAHVAGANPVTAILDPGFPALSAADKVTAINAVIASIAGKTAAEAVAVLAQLSAGSVAINMGGVVTAAPSAGYAGLDAAVKDAFLEVAAQAEANGQIDNAVLTAIAAF